jgi:Hint domain
MADLQIALTDLTNAQTLDDVRSIANTLSAKATGPGGVLYSGTVGDSISNPYSGEVAQQIADTEGVPIIDNTLRGQFLKDPVVATKIQNIIAKSNPNLTAEEISNLVKQELFGTGISANTSLWGEASAEFVASLSGNITIVSTNVNAAGVLANVEIPAILNNGAITSINGVALRDLPATVPEFVETIQSSFTAAANSGGIFYRVINGGEQIYISSEVLAKLGLSSSGAESASALVASGLQKVTVPALEETTAGSVVDFLLAAGGDAIELVGASVATFLGATLVFVLVPDEVEEGKDELVAQQGIVSLDVSSTPPNNVEQPLVDNGRTVSLMGGQTSDKVGFVSANSTLLILNSQSFLGTIDGFVPGNTIDLADIISVSSATISVGKVLNIQGLALDGATTYVNLILDPTQDYSHDEVFVSPDGLGGSKINIFDISPILSGSTAVTITDLGYGATVTLTPGTIQFAPKRYNGNERFDSTTVEVAIGNLEPSVPRGAFVQISGGQSAGGGGFYTYNSFVILNSPTDSTTTDISVGSNVVPGRFSGIQIPVTITYSVGFLEEKSATANLTVNQNVYATAAASFSINGLSTEYYDFGLIHVGQSASVGVTITNTATGSLTDTLSSSIGSEGLLSTKNAITDIASGSSSIVTVDVATNVVGDFIADESLFNLVSHDPELPDVAAGANITFVGSVVSYATPTLVKAFLNGDQIYEISPDGTLTQNGDNWNLDLGTITYQDTGAVDSVPIAIGNGSLADSDALAGSIAASGDGIIYNLGDTNIENPLLDGDYAELGEFSPNVSQLGEHTLTIVYQPLSVSNIGTAALPDITLTVTDNVVALCFLAGTHIATPVSEVPVENLATGDKVLNLAGEIRRIVWIGTGKSLATRGRRTAATPIIVRKGALAPNVPYQDLHVTKGHSFYLDGVLIPVEFLVNHRSILWDDRAQEVTVYHIELESHDVLLANGAPAESYRDDGNRWLFQNANSGWHLPPQEPYAPVLTGGPVVDAVWRRLLDRAGPRPGLPLTDDPDVHLRVDGVRVDGARFGNRCVFKLQSVPDEVRLVSRAASPAELGLARDPRVLGVAVQRVELWQGPKVRVVDAADERLTDGFHSYEPDGGIRWTDGDAQLPIGVIGEFVGAMEVVVHLGGATQYIDGLAASRAA